MQRHLTIDKVAMVIRFMKVQRFSVFRIVAIASSTQSPRYTVKVLEWVHNLMVPMQWPLYRQLS